MTDGIVFSLHFLCFDLSWLPGVVPVGEAFCCLWRAEEEERKAGRSEIERSHGWSEERSRPSSRSGLKVGRETESDDVGCGRAEPKEAGPSCLSGSLVLLSVLAFRWWTMEGFDSSERTSLVLTPSLLELVGEVLFENAESLRLRAMSRGRDSVEGSDPAEGAGDITTSDSPMAESLLE